MKQVKIQFYDSFLLKNKLASPKTNTRMVVILTEI